MTNEKNTWSILLVEDNPADTGLITRRLKKEGHTVACISKLEEVGAHLTQNQPDIVLSDYRLQGFTGMDVLLGTKAVDPSIPVIIVSGTIGDQVAVAIMKAGASDFVSKDHLDLLPGAILRAIGETELQKEKEEAVMTLEHREKRFRKLIEHSADVLLLLDGEFRITYASPSTEQVLGYKPEQLEGTFGYDIPAEVDLAYSEQFYRRALSNPGEHVKAKYRCKTAWGKPEMMEGTVTNYLHDPDIGSLVINFRNISKQHEAEEALKHSEDFHRIILEDAFDGVLIMDKEGLIIYESPSNKVAMGYEPGDLTGTSAFQLVHPDDIPKAQVAFERIMQKPQNKEHFSYRGRHKEGHYIHLDATGVNLLHEENVKGIVVNFRNVTEQVEAEKNRKRLTEIIESASDFISIAGVDNHPIYINPAGLNMLEAPEYFDYASRTLEEFHPKDLLPKIQDEVIPALGEMGFWRGESILLTHTGKHIPISQSIAVHKDAEGDVEYISTIIRDMSAAKKREQELHTSQAELKERIKELRCLLGVSELLHTTEAIDQKAATKIVHLIEPAYKYPEITKVRLRIFDKVTSSEGFAETHWRQVAPIFRGSKEVGELEVFYLEERPTEDEGVFLKEERKLINSLASQIGTWLQSIATHEAIKTSQERLQNITDAIPGVVFRSKADKHGAFEFEFVSNSVRELMGIEPLDLVKDSSLALKQILPDDRKEFEKALQSAFVANAPLNHEFRVWDKHGNIRWASIRSLPEKMEGGIRHANGIITDITDKKEVQQFIIDSERSYRQLFDNSQELIYIQDLDGTFIDVNQKVLTTYGYTREEIIGKSPEFLGAEGKNDLEEVFAKLEKTVAGEPQQFKWSAKKKNGEIFYKDVLVQRGLYFGKDVIIAFGRDITQQLEAEKAIQRNVQLFQQLFKNSPLAKVLIDENYQVKSINQAFQDLFGFSEDEAKSRVLYELIVPDSRLSEVVLIKDKLKNRKSFVLESIRMKKDKTELPVYVYGVPVAHDNELIGFYLMFVDLSDKKRAEEELKLLNTELVRYNEELEQYAYVASHNLRAPLSNILGLVNAIEEGKLDNGNKEIFSRIKVSSDQADKVLREIVDSLEKTTKQDHFNELVSVPDVLTELKGQMSERLRSVGAKINSQIAVDLIYFNKILLKEIVYQLMDNAIKFHHPQRALNITIETSIEGDLFQLSFSDNGIGMDIGRHGHRLFKMYHQLAPVATEGRGLGLYLIRKHLEMAGGTVRVESKPDEGTTFMVYIPLVKHTT